ncbi:MAG: MFS transporter [Myxococcota bacterium]
MDSRLWPLLAIHFIGTLGYSIAIPFLVFLVTDFGGDSVVYGFVGATYSACQLIGAPLLGRLSDRVGRTPVLVVSQLGTALAWLLFLVALYLPMDELMPLNARATLTVPLLFVFLARALDGVTGGNVSVANALVADLTVGNAEARGQAFARMGIAASLGMVLGPALAGLLGGTSWGYTLPVVGAGVLALAASVLVLVLLREPEKRCPEPAEPPGNAIAAVGAQVKDCSRSPEATPRVDLTKLPGIPALIGAAFVQLLAFNLFYSSFPIFAAQGLGWDVGSLGGFFALMSVSMIVAQGPLLDRLTPTWSPSAIFALGQASLAVAFVLMMTGETWLVLVASIAFAVGNGLGWPTFQALVADRSPDEAQGAVQGAVTSAMSFASIVGLLVGGFLYPTLGTGLFVLCAVLFALMGVATPWLWREPRDPQEQPVVVPQS